MVAHRIMYMPQSLTSLLFLYTDVYESTELAQTGQERYLHDGRRYGRVDVDGGQDLPGADA